MSFRPNLVTAYEVLLDAKEKELRSLRSDIRKIVHGEHSIRDTKAAHTSVAKREQELDEIFNSLSEAKEVSEEFQNQAERLCRRCRDLELYIRDMNAVLNNDLVEQRYQKDRKTIDVIKNATFFFAVPTAFVAGVNNGLFKTSVTAYHAAAAGITVASAFLGRKKIIHSFKNAYRDVCDAPREIQNSFMLYYIRESMKEKAGKVSNKANKMISKVRNRTGFSP
jgi:hypothetical protein